MENLIPLSVILPDLPSGEVLTSDQWQTLMSIADTCIQSISAAGSETISSTSHRSQVESAIRSYLHTKESVGVLGQYIDENASANPGFKEALKRTLSLYVPKDSLRGLSFMLSALSNQAGCLFLTGSRTPFHLQPISVRETIILNWRASYLPPLNLLYKSLTTLIIRTWIVTSPTFPKIIGFPRFPTDSPRNPGFDFDFVAPPPLSTSPLTNSPQTTDPELFPIDIDAIVIGSGCGAGVTASNLSRSGLRVLVLEKGHHFSTQHFPMDVPSAGAHLFESGGAIPSDDTSIVTIAGSCFGGGGLVNWSASLHTQAHVRREWSQKHGLKHFESQDFQACLDRVAERMGASTEFIEHNEPNRTLAEGARRLGLNVHDVPQNTGGMKHDCGYCTNGCASATKQGPAVCYLPDAARHGARFMQGFYVERILFDDETRSPGDKPKAIGVIGTWTPPPDGSSSSSPPSQTPRRLKILAPLTILCAGTLHSPLILRRSLPPTLQNPHIGSNLHLHPTLLVRARYPHPIKAWEGAILTTVVDLGESKIETPSMIPFIASACTSWNGAAEFKKEIAGFGNWVAFIIVTRDEGSGKVYEEKPETEGGKGRVRIQYSPTNSKIDIQNCFSGVLEALRIHYIMGAVEIASIFPGLQSPFLPDPSLPSSTNDENFSLWLSHLRSLANSRSGFSPTSCTFLTAHQMSTCRMSVSPKAGVVDPEGKVWGTEGLFVADASVMPTASGVNPMISTMGIAEGISGGVAREWVRREGRGSVARL